MNQIRFAFFGTPELSVEVLNALEARGFLPALVVTAPDKPRGRGLTLSPSPVKEWATARDIEVAEPARLRDNEDFFAELGNTDWDVFLVAAYAKLIPKYLLEMPRRGCLNMHPSLLPKLRGPSPILSAILSDEREVGVSIMLMTERMDAGPVVAQARISIEEQEWPMKNSHLEALLAHEGGNLLAEVLPAWVEGSIEPEVQDEKAATFTRKYADEDALIDFSGNAREQLLKVRAFDRNPKAHFFADISGKKMRIIVTDAEVQSGAFTPISVIPEGKKEIAWETWKRTVENRA